MRLLRFLVAIGLCAALVGGGAITGTASADPMNDNTLTLTLFNCSGPAGTPTTFQTTKTLSSGSSGHVVGSTDIFKRTSLTDLVTGETFTWGPKNGDKPLITCNLVQPINGHLLLVTGFLTPQGGESD